MPGKASLAIKQKALDNLIQAVDGAESVVFSNYQGLTVDQDTEMRKGMREAGVSYTVVKNTLALRAFDQMGITGLEEICKGPTAIAWSKEDVTLAPRLVKKYVDQFKKTEIKGGIVNNELSDLDTIQALANIPTLEVLYGQLVSRLIFPVTSLAMTLGALAKKGEEAGIEQVADLVEAKTEEAPATEDAPAADQAETPADPEVTE
ncbi:MAG: 50S ribosomal protein L10 [Eubacteriales bacterium]|nr:50S ribosomal protein L10 [Eubacteriales bacterium]